MTFDELVAAAKHLSPDDALHLIYMLLYALPLPNASSAAVRVALLRAELLAILPDDGHFGEHVIAALEDSEQDQNDLSEE